MTYLDLAGDNFLLLAVSTSLKVQLTGRGKVGGGGGSRLLFLPSFIILRTSHLPTFEVGMGFARYVSTRKTLEHTIVFFYSSLKQLFNGDLQAHISTEIQCFITNFFCSIRFCPRQKLLNLLRRNLASVQVDDDGDSGDGGQNDEGDDDDNDDAKDAVHPRGGGKNNKEERKHLCTYVGVVSY